MWCQSYSSLRSLSFYQVTSYTSRALYIADFSLDSPFSFSLCVPFPSIVDADGRSCISSWSPSPGNNSIEWRMKTWPLSTTGYVSNLHLLKFFGHYFRLCFSFCILLCACMSDATPALVAPTSRFCVSESDGFGGSPKTNKALWISLW